LQKLNGKGDLSLLKVIEMLNNSSKGFTLIEVVIVIVILSIISSITIYFLINSLRIYTMTVNQKTLLDEGKLALERMCRDIRNARAISSPAAGGSGSLIRFTRTHATSWDVAGEVITFRRTGSTLQRVKASPSVTSAIASNVSTFTVNRAASNEITLVLTLSLASGENVTLQTRVYPKNMGDSTTYKTYFQFFEEMWSS
jgi:prepilin-type N-terminal cleavage/methylation domain-containing protein